MEDHFIQCMYCNKEIDMRDLSDVFFHSLGTCISGKAKKDIPYSSSKRVGDNVEWTKDKKKIDLN